MDEGRVEKEEGENEEKEREDEAEKKGDDKNDHIDQELCEDWQDFCQLETLVELI